MKVHTAVVDCVPAVKDFWVKGSLDEEGNLLITDQLQSFVIASSSRPFMILVRDSQHIE